MWWNKVAADQLLWMALAMELASASDVELRRLVAFARARRRVWLVVAEEGGLVVM